ncbi:MAG TPA: RsmB/NOP family class I SAM-dependent RNA methyltransferase, partial [Archangium sp.]
MDESKHTSGDIVGIASRKAATAVLKAHVAVIKGTPMRRAIGEALDEGGNLGGKERRFIAFATRELSRHLRLLNLHATTRGYGTSRLNLPEDQAVLRYALWRREVCKAGVEKIMTEVQLPGPIRPRGIPDQVVRAELERTVELDFGKTPLDQAATRHSFPTWLAEKIAAVAPPGELEAVLEALNREPTLT